MNHDEIVRQILNTWRVHTKSIFISSGEYRLPVSIYKVLITLFLGSTIVYIQPAMLAQQVSGSELTVFAAASLNEAFRAVAEEYKSTNPGQKITFNFAGSQQLAQQLAQGAPVEVFASANMKQMTEAVQSGRIDSVSIKVFVHNRLIIVFPKENTAEIHSLHDLSKPRLKIILADNAVPAGQYAIEFLERCNRSAAFDSLFKQKVLGNVVSYEENVKAVLSKVVLDEADAGIVYTSDVGKNAAEHVGTIEIPDDVNVIATYPIAVVRDGKSPEQAEKFVRYILSDEGQTILARFGFIPIAGKTSKK